MDAAFLEAFLASPEGVALRALLVGSIIVAALGIFAALRDGTFDLKYIASFVRTTVWGKVAPTGVVLVVGYVLNDQTVRLAAVPIAAAVALDLIKSAIDSLKQMTLPKPESAAINTPPTG